VDNFSDFANISAGITEAAAKQGELNEYLQHPAKKVKDPLKWWFLNRALYLNLHRMVLDYLSIPCK